MQLLPVSMAGNAGNVADNGLSIMNRTKYPRPESSGYIRAMLFGAVFGALIALAI